MPAHSLFLNPHKERSLNRREVLASILPAAASLAICDVKEETPESLSEYLSSMMGSPKINLSIGVKESIRFWVKVVFENEIRNKRKVALDAVVRETWGTEESR